jgi:CheY-like chemotaxis protein
MTRPALSHHVRHLGSRPGRRVLVADSDEAMRHTLARLLERAGYGVVTCSNSDDALALLTAPGQAFGALVIEARIPGSLDGMETAGRVTELRTGTAVIVVAAADDELEAGRTEPLVQAVVPRAEATRLILGHVRAALGR